MVFSILPVFKRKKKFVFLFQQLTLVMGAFNTLLSSEHALCRASSQIFSGVSYLNTILSFLSFFGLIRMVSYPVGD